MDIKNLEESKPDFAKNWLNEKKHFEILASEMSMKWKNWRELRKCDLTNSPRTNWEKVMLATIQELTLQIQQLQERMNYMNDPRELQDVESICSGKLSHSQSTGNCSKSWWDAEPRPKSATWNMEFAWYIGKRVWQSTCSDQFVIDSLSRTASLLESKCYRRKPSAKQYRETCRWKWRTKPRDDSNAEICKETLNHEFFLPAEGAHPQNCMVFQQRLQISELQFRKFPTPSTFSCWKIRFKTQC